MTSIARATQAGWLRASRRAFPRPALSLILAAVPVLLILGVLAVVLLVSVREEVTRPALTLRHYADLYTDPFTYRALLNTVAFALITLAVALVVGVPAAWLVERTDLRGRAGVYTAMSLGVLLPGFLTAMGWLFLLHPRIGIVNQAAVNLLGLERGPFNIVSLPGMGLVQGLTLAPLVFVMTAAGLQTMDASLEEAARTSGASFFATLRRVTLPLAAPSLLAAALYTITIGISAFDIPAVIGLSDRIFTFGSYLYFQTHPAVGLPEYGGPAAFSSFMVLVALLLSWWYGRMLLQARRYQVITGRSHRPRPIALGRWAILAWIGLGGYLVLAQGLPFLLLVWAALLPYLQPPSPAAVAALSLRNFDALPWPLIGRGLANTAILMVGAPTLALLFSLIISWVVLRSRHRFRLLFDYAAFLPHAVPHVVFGLGALLVALFVLRGSVDLYGTVTLILIVYVLVQLSFGTRITHSALIQIHPELEEAAYTSGAGTLAVVRGVILPLLRPALVNGWLLLALIAIRELTLATMLFTPDNITLSVVVWNLWFSGRLVQAAAVTLLMIAVLAPLVLLYWRLAGGKVWTQ